MLRCRSVEYQRTRLGRCTDESYHSIEQSTSQVIIAHFSFLRTLLWKFGCLFYIFYRFPLVKHAAEKARNSLAMGLYEKLFQQIVIQINVQLSSSSSASSIGILDIAGFGKSKIDLFRLILKLIHSIFY